MAINRLLRIAAAGVLAAAGSLLTLAPAQAAHIPAHPAANINTPFELDGNITNNGKDDWITVNTGGGAANIVARTGVLSDPAPLTIFTGGGSKDDLNLSGTNSSAGGWKHKSGSVPDKDNIVNAYAVAYNVGGDLVINAAAERFDNSGDAHMGFWFFKSNISLNANGSFNGTHSVGDILVLANFEGGGTTVTIQILKWDPGAGAINGTLRLLASSAAAKCAPNTTIYCGITNAQAGETPSPNWSYLSKDNTTSYPVATFLEVGINITKVLLDAGDTSAPCFTSFMAETRSSSSVDAVLKDFVLGSFNVCGVQISKLCPSGQANAAFDRIIYEFGGAITNTGFGAVTNVTLFDTPQPATPAPVVGGFTYYQCNTAGDYPNKAAPLTFAGSIAPNSSVCYLSTLTTTNNPSTNFIKVVANTGPTSTVDATSPVANCPRLEFPAFIKATKDCTVSLVPTASYLYVKVDIWGSVCNDALVPLSSASAIDKVLGMSNAALTLSSTNLAPKGQTGDCATYSASYNPIAPDPNTATQFSDAVSATAIKPPITGCTGAACTVGTAVDAGASCNLCPPGVECKTPSGATLNTLMKQLEQQKKK